MEKILIDLKKLNKKLNYIFKTYGVSEVIKKKAYEAVEKSTIQPTIDPMKQEWISVKDDMPKERESIFARFYGTDKWRTGMFRTASDDVIACVEYEDGSRLVKVLHTISGEWHMSGIPGGGIVTHWMPLPEPPERDGE